MESTELYTKSLVDSSINQINSDHIEIAAEIKKIQEIFDECPSECSETITILVIKIDIFHNRLQKHFALEESDPSLQEFKMEHPCISNRLMSIYDEHTHLLKMSLELKDLCLQQKEQGNFTLEILNSNFKKFKSFLKSHDARETEIYLDAAYIEIGGEG